MTDTSQTTGAPLKSARAATATVTIPRQRRPPHGPARRVWPVDLSVLALYFAIAVFLTRKMWGATSYVQAQPDDQVLFEWMFSRTAHAVTTLQNPLFTTQIGAPDGVNLMSNTSVLGLSIPFTPLTLLFGPHVSFVVCVILSLSGTAAAWYLVLRRMLVPSRFAAAVGALFCGFAPSIVTQAQGHLQMSAQFLVPFIVWTVFSLANYEKPLKAAGRGLVLGLLVAYQFFIGAETLLLTVLALGIIVVVLLIADPRARQAAPRVLIGLGSGGALAAALLAYPLWFYLFGPASYHGVPFPIDQYGLDAASYGAYSNLSLGGRGWSSEHLAPNAVEQASYLGYPLIALCVVIVIWLRRRPLVWALAITSVIFTLLSFGPTLRFNGRSWVAGPYRLIDGIPLVDSIVPARFALVLTPIVGVLIALSLAAVRRAPRTVVLGLQFRVLWTGAVAAAMLPAMPSDIYVLQIQPVPAFITSGEWRRLVPEDSTLVAVPTRGLGQPNSAMYWSSQIDDPFGAPGGYYIGPTSPTDKSASWGGQQLPSSLLFDQVHHSGVPAPVTGETRAQFVEDLRQWRAAIVVLGPVYHQEALRLTLVDLLGPGQRIDGVWVWDVRSLVGP